MINADVKYTKIRFLFSIHCVQTLNFVILYILFLPSTVNNVYLIETCVIYGDLIGNYECE